MTLTEKRELTTPWEFVIAQMSETRGPGFISLYLSLRIPAATKVTQKLLSDL